MGRAVMVQGTASSAGKSLLTTALCPYAARAGIDVAPFKAQNMSNNARVVDGGEIGTAQALQAWAARVTPDLRMNPVLVKPESDTRSQVVRLGRVDHTLSRRRWRDRAAAMWDDIRASLRALLDAHDLVIIEGAGSPAEFNLWPWDLANMRVATEADAPVLLGSDIDRGGALAHCYGTWALLPADERARIRGFVMNRFRGDPGLLRPGLAGLHERTGVPVVGVLPWMDHGPEEDAAGGCHRTAPGDVAPVAVVAYPSISNLDEFSAIGADKLTAHTRTRFASLPGVWRAWSRQPVEGYETRHGVTSAVGDVAVAVPGGVGTCPGAPSASACTACWRTPDWRAPCLTAPTYSASARCSTTWPTP